MKKIIGITLVLSCFALVNTVSAQQDNQAGNLEERMNQFKSQLEARLQERCGLIESRIELSISRYENNYERHLANYNKMKDKLNEIIAKISDKGYDTSDLENDVSYLDAEINQFRNNYSDYIGKLRNTGDYACGQSEGQFATALEESRQSLMTVRQDSLDIRLYYQQTVRPHIQALREQIQSDMEVQTNNQ